MRRNELVRNKSERYWAALGKESYCELDELGREIETGRVKWHGMVWYGMVRYGVVWYGMVLPRMVILVYVRNPHISPQGLALGLS